MGVGASDGSISLASKSMPLKKGDKILIEFRATKYPVATGQWNTRSWDGANQCGYTTFVSNRPQRESKRRDHAVIASLINLANNAHNCIRSAAHQRPLFKSPTLAAIRLRASVFALVQSVDGRQNVTNLILGFCKAPLFESSVFG